MPLPPPNRARGARPRGERFCCTRRPCRSRRRNERRLVDPRGTNRSSWTASESVDRRRAAPEHLHHADAAARACPLAHLQVQPVARAREPALPRPQELQRDVLRIRVFYYKRGFRETEVDTAVTPTQREAGRGAVQRRSKGRRRSSPTSQVVSDSDALPAATAAPAHAAQGRASRSTCSRWTRRASASRTSSGSSATATRSWTRRRSSIRSRARRRCSSASSRTISRASVTIVISGTDEISPTTVLNSLTFRPGDLYRRSTRAREPAQPVRIEPVPPRHDPGPRDVRQRQDGARRGFARRGCTRCASAADSTRSTTSRPRAASRTTTCSAARVGST